MILACVTAVLLSTVSARAQLASPFKITSFVLNTNGAAVLQWQGANTNIVVQFTADVAFPLWQPLPGVAWPIIGSNWSGVIPMSPGKGFLRVVTTGGVGTAPIPLKTVSLTLIGWHDPLSHRYMANCISCHGTRTQELALDGTTPSAHSTMLGEFGVGNSRCITCHTFGPDFLTHSVGALRKQVNYEISGCTGCHDAISDPSFYVR
jgi:hypothetical protein